ncbi:MAG TPA: DUF1501 domain-containing protein [Longimicrobiales bacterium]|nr:DUF1501 domain-containing protein [Longimicrobiales bacterium]
MDRRNFLRTMCVGGAATFALPSVAFARVPGQGRLMFALLRGGFDGLAALVPIGDPGYRALRGPMAFDAGDLIALDDGFALAPGLAPFAEFWERGELLAVHAMAIPYRTRSHFDGQAILETGLERPDGAADGWLNRLLQVMGGERSGIAVSAGMPRSLTGEHPVMTWSPASLGTTEAAYIDRLHALYQRDRVLLNPFEAALQLEALGESAMDDEGSTGGRSMEARARRPRGAFEPVLGAAARFLREPAGPNVAAVEFSGWDTHANQGLAGGSLDRLLGGLSSGLAAFREAMGPRWADTTVVVMTEFGRTARPNGTGGTDHGTAGAGFVLGPRIARSAVLADWPGLAERQLYEGRDVRPTLDTRSVLKGVLAGTFDLTRAQSERVFPDSEAANGMFELMG